MLPEWTPRGEKINADASATANSAVAQAHDSRGGGGHDDLLQLLMRRDVVMVCCFGQSAHSNRRYCIATYRIVEHVVKKSQSRIVGSSVLIGRGR